MQVVTCKPELLVPANPVILDGIPDLTGLTYLNEPSILHGLNLRYAEDQIYTHAGPVLIAINPFKQVCTLLLFPGPMYRLAHAFMRALGAACGHACMPSSCNSIMPSRSCSPRGGHLRAGVADPRQGCPLRLTMRGEGS